MGFQDNAKQVMTQRLHAKQEELQKLAVTRATRLLIKYHMV